MPIQVYGLFCDQITEQSVRRFFQTLAAATATESDIEHVHVLFQSFGGTVNDGVCLYNFFRAFPVDLTLYNVGFVGSSAVIAYLGAKKRKTSARASFVLHRGFGSIQNAKAASLKAFTDSVILDDQRTEAIMRDHITALNWADLDNGDLFVSGEDAVKMGLADEIGEFTPPAGTRLFYI